MTISTKTVLKWLLVTAAIWCAGFLMIYSGYGNAASAAREPLLVIGLIIVYGSLFAIAIELILLISKWLGSIYKA